MTESDNAYEITVELPNLDQKNIAVKLTHGGLTIRGDKRDETYFALPDGVNSDKIEATFKYGVLKVVLPKTEEAQGGSQDHQRQGGLRLRWGEAVPPASLILQVPSIGEGPFMRTHLIAGKDLLS
ncbi:Hsp20/alpha crystallin family protein [Bradyrhizobium sp. CCBAU 45389]|uniref:Hsp20/alpha crystallin family protein n=1 Tax=Bradyrhizobium sp. CCBAU 45389 TaxID=858429 RepID=UPI002FE26DA5